jgi:hypothetical protein
MNEIRSIEHLSSTDIRYMARTAYAAHLQLADCPFQPGTNQSDRWRKEFIALELADEESFV